MKPLLTLPALLCALLAGCSKAGPDNGTLKIINSTNSDIDFSKATPVLNTGKTTLFNNLNFGGAVTDYTLGYDITKRPSNNWQRNVYLPSNYTGTVRIGTNVIWPKMSP